MHLFFFLFFFFCCYRYRRHLHSFPTRRSSDLMPSVALRPASVLVKLDMSVVTTPGATALTRMPRSPSTDAKCFTNVSRSEEHTSELQSRQYLVCRLLLEKKKKQHMKNEQK